jgi:uncharacterized protein
MARTQGLSMVFGLIVFVLILGFIEFYAFKSLLAISGGWSIGAKLALKLTYWGITVSLVVLAFLAFRNFAVWRVESPHILSLILGAIAVVFFPKLIMAVFHLTDDIRYAVAWVVKNWSSTSTASGGEAISRATFITKTGQVLGGLAFFGFLYGVTRGRYNYHVINQTIVSEDLPAAFDGMRIVQFSDAHVGSFYNDFEPVKEGIRLINELNADYIFFTGDLVNNLAEEAEPWIPIFQGLKAKKGKFSIFGNHDYADYGMMPEEKRLASRKRLVEIHDEMGFKLMMNEGVELERGGQKIGLLGVENWGKGFRQSGDLKKAKAGVNGTDFNILLTHDPTHWEEEVLAKEKIQLTLSGHTHGMQMGVEIPALNIKFSPARLRYKRWGGLYQEGKQFLHVNRGFGFIGFPGRVGMPPEITLIELKKA